MRTARTLVALVAAAIAALALGATANAAGIEVTDEAGGHCPEVETNGSHTVTGGCVVSAETELDQGNPTSANLAAHIPGSGEIVVSECVNSFDARIHETGDGLIYNQVLTDRAGSAIPCNRTACDEASGAEDPHAEIPWPINAFEFNPGNLDAQVTFCVREPAEEEGDGNSACTVQLDVAAEGSHDYEFRTDATRRCSQLPAVSLTGHWVTTSGNIEIAH